MRSTLLRSVLLAAMLVLGANAFTQKDLDAVRKLSQKIDIARQVRTRLHEVTGSTQHSLQTAGGRALLAALGTTTATKCIFSGCSTCTSNRCELNALYLASSDFGQDPKTATQKLLMHDAYLASQCAAKNSDQAGCNALDTCEYTKTTNNDDVCQYEDGASFSAGDAPFCTDATVGNFESLFLGALCAAFGETSCKESAEACNWNNGACTSKFDLTAVAAFYNYVFKGQGEFDDKWVGKCETGKIIKGMLTKCHGTDQAACEKVAECKFEKGEDATDPSYCTIKDEAATKALLGDNEFTKKLLEAQADCAGKKANLDTCEATRVTFDPAKVSAYNNLAQLQSDARDKGSAASVTSSALLMAMSVLAAIMLALVM